MLLSLKYDQSLSRTANAVYIRGASAAVWLREIAAINVSVERLDCYVVPESIRSVAAAGLLVTIKGEVSALPAHLPAYSLMAKHLYLPSQSALYPPVTDDELGKLLLWDVQFFHPTIGLVGFEKADRIDLLSLIACQAPDTLRWDLAASGQPPIPPLERISVEPLDEDVMSLFEKDLDRKPLGDIPKAPGEKSGRLDKIKRDAAYHSLKTAMGIRDAIAKFLSSGDSAPEAPSEGIFLPIFGVIGLLLWPFMKGYQEIDKWATKSLEQLEKERNDEIKRLLDMLDEDPSEALKYAIPLSSYHESRGQAEQGSRLTARDTNFNLGALGGGGAADVWDIGDRYADLRAKYLKAATLEIKKGNFKRAAYIYAHLLGDFNLAANTLMQGHMYREAAELYKKHLKNIPAAADCLEKGGLLNDAIDLYIELEKDEKVGDLYMQLEQLEAAGKYYMQAADKYLATNNYLETARIYEEKMDLTVKACAALLKGWGTNVQPEACLKKYFKLVAMRTPDALAEGIVGVYKFNTRPEMRKYFLNTLQYAQTLTDSSIVKQTTTDIAYEVISEQIGEGDLSTLFMLNSFVEQDKMLNSDLSRFAHKERSAPTMKKSAVKMQLRKDVKWERVYEHRNQLYALGFQKDNMHFARVNWYGDVDNLVWSEHLLHHNMFLIISPYNKDTVLLYSQGENSSSSQYLPRNKYFNDTLNIEYTTWMPKDAVGLAMNEQGDVGILQYVDGVLVLSRYTMDGKLQDTIDCKVNGKLIDSYSSFTSPPEMIYRVGHYFTLMFGALISVSEKGGHTEMHYAEAPIWRIAVSPKLDRADFLIATDGCVSLLSFAVHKQIDSYPGRIAGHDNRFEEQEWSKISVSEEVTAMVFLADMKIAITTGSELEIFNIEANPPKSEKKFRTSVPIVGAVATTNRNSCAVLLQNGKIEVFEW